MEFGFTHKQEELRKQIREFFIEQLPSDYNPGTRANITKEQQSFCMQLQEKAGAKGYLTPGWSVDSGGLGLGPIEQGIVEEEWGYARVAWPNYIGLHLAGPALHLFGTEEQKGKFLPGIAKGKVVWFQAFTEPDAGSDEANVQLRATRDGDNYILNGQKVFIGQAHKPDYLYTLARTELSIPKHRGLSLFLVPADTPGITYRPLPTMGDDHNNEIFYDDVRISKEYLLGTLNRGFYHAMATFEFERGGTAGPATSKRDLEEFLQFCKEEKRNGKPLIKDPAVRSMLAQMAIEVQVHRLTAWHAVWWFSQREKLGPQPYDLTGFLMKTFATRHAEAMMKVLGVYGQLRQASKWAKLAGRIERRWQFTRSLHAGGTLEIYKIVAAQRGLGLPRPQRYASKAGER